MRLENLDLYGIDRILMNSVNTVQVQIVRKIHECMYTVRDVNPSIKETL